MCLGHSSSVARHALTNGDGSSFCGLSVWNLDWAEGEGTPEVVFGFVYGIIDLIGWRLVIFETTFLGSAIIIVLIFLSFMVCDLVFVVGLLQWEGKDTAGRLTARSISFVHGI